MSPLLNALILVVVLTCEINGSQLAFRTNEPFIHPVLTKSLRLRCSVIYDVNTLRPQLAAPPMKETAATAQKSESSVYMTTTISEIQSRGNRQIHDMDMYSYLLNVSNTETTNNSVISSPLYISSQADVTHVISILVKKEISGKSVTLAKVTPYDQATGFAWVDSSVQVRGDSEKSPLAGEQAYLELTWAPPKDEQAGAYTCEMYALNADSLPISLSAILQVTSSQPTFDDLISYIIDNNKIITHQEDVISRLQNETSRLEEEVFKMTNNYSRELGELKVQLQTLTTPNTETGVVKCPFLNSISFNKQFKREPLVVVSLISLYNPGFNNHYEFKASTENITTSGFYFNCTSDNYNNPTYQWYAYGF